MPRVDSSPDDWLVDDQNGAASVDTWVTEAPIDVEDGEMPRVDSSPDDWLVDDQNGAASVDTWVGEAPIDVEDELTPPNALARSISAAQIDQYIEADGPALGAGATGVEQPADMWSFVAEDGFDTGSTSSGVTSEWTLYSDAPIDSGNADRCMDSAQTSAGLVGELTPEHPQQQPYISESAEPEVQRLKQLGAAAKKRAERGEATDDDILLIAQALDVGALQLYPRPTTVEPTHVYHLYSESGPRLRSGNGYRDKPIDRWINTGGKNAVVVKGVEAHQLPRSLRHQRAKLAKRRGKIASQGASEFKYRSFVIGFDGDRPPSSTSLSSICIWQILPQKLDGKTTVTNQPAQEHSETRPHADGALELLSDVTVEPISQAGYAVPSVCDDPAFVNPAASMIGDRSETVATVNLGLVQDLHTVLSKRSRDDETEATQPRRSRRKSILSKHTSAIAVVSTAVVALMAYAVMTNERLLAHSFSAPETGIPLLRPPAPPPPVLPWPSVHWEKRSNAPACRDNGWIEKNTKACVAADGDSETGSQASTYISESLDYLNSLVSGSQTWDGVRDWHLPNGFASWRNGTHVFAFGGQQSGMALDTRSGFLNGNADPGCNDAAGVMTLSNELWTTALDDAKRGGADHVWTHVGGGPSFAAESSCDSPPSWPTMYWDIVTQGSKVHTLYAGTSTCWNKDWPRARTAAQSWTIREDERDAGALLFSGWYTSPCGFTSSAGDGTANKRDNAIAMLPADLWKFNTSSHCWQILGGANSNARSCKGADQCASVIDIEAHSYCSGADDRDDLVRFSQIRLAGYVQGSWASAKQTGNVPDGRKEYQPWEISQLCQGRAVAASTKWPLGRWSAQTWTMSAGDGQRMFLFSGRLHIRGGESVHCADAEPSRCISTDFLLNDLWSLRRRAKSYDSEPQLDSIDSTEWAWEQHAKCVGFNRSATAAPGPRMGGASWVTDAARVSLARKPTETIDRAWIFGGVGLRRSAHVGVVKTCLLDPLVATSGSLSAHQPVATGLCDLWSFDGDRWQPHGDCATSNGATPYVGPPRSFFGTSWSDASGRLLLMPGADCNKGDCLPELRDDGQRTGCNSKSPEFARTLQSGPLTSAVRCSSELWEFSPAVNRWHMLAPRGPDDRCGVISYKLHAQSNASERYELLGGWVSAKNASTATCAHGGRHFVSTAADFAAANFSYAIELVANDTRY